MKNIILQHWSGQMNDLGRYSSANIKKYADKCGADYRLLLGDVFRPKLSSPCQKLFMLDKTFDEFDTVVMLDMDMFTRKGMTENIFDASVTGIGMRTDFQSVLFEGLCQKQPTLTSPKHPYWGGAVYKLDRETRQKLRVHIKDDEMAVFNRFYEDEGIMHRLATLANLPSPNALPGNNKWCCGSYEANVEQAALIHIRTRTSPSTTEKKPKLENLFNLVSMGLIDTL